MSKQKSFLEDDKPTKSDIVRQVGLSVQGEFVDGFGNTRLISYYGIVYTQYKSGKVTRYTVDRLGKYQNDETEVGFLHTYKVDRNAYHQHIAFKRFIAQHEYGITYERAIARGLLAPRPETWDEKRAKMRAWWETGRRAWEKVKTVASENKS